MESLRALVGQTETQERRDMSSTERLARGIGSTVLGLYGVAVQMTGIATFNPIAVGLGSGSVYLAERVARPYFNEIYGEPTHDQSNTKRFLRYNASVVPSYIGAVLLGGAIFREGLSVAERVASVALSIPSFISSNIMEKKAHTGEPYFKKSLFKKRSNQ